MSVKHTVVAVLSAKEGKEEELRQELVNIVELSRNEDTNIDYRLHQDKNNPKTFILYENWVSQDAHSLQFDKPYIVTLIDKLPDLLDGPYQVYMAEELSEVCSYEQ